MVSIFTDQTPDVTDANDLTAYSLGTKFFATTAGLITHGRWRFPDTAPGGPVSWVLYDEATEVELARAVFTDTGPGWQTVALDPPVTYATPTTVLVAVVETPNRYVASINFFETAIVNGALTAPADGDNGRLAAGAAYPTDSFNDACYFADLVFAASAGSVAPDGIAVAVTLGEPAVEQVATDGIVPDGIAVPASLGEPAVTWTTTVFPTSITAAATAGGAVATQSLTVTPDGVAALTSLGSPTVDDSSSEESEPPVAGAAWVRDTTDI